MAILAILYYEKNKKSSGKKHEFPHLNFGKIELTKIKQNSII